MPTLLAQAATNTDVSRIVLAVSVLLGAVLVLALALLKMRRRLLADDDSSASPLTLHDLRRLHAGGAMSDEEFERAKAALIGAAGAGPRSRPLKHGRAAPERGASAASGYSSTGSSTDKSPDSGSEGGADGGGGGGSD